MNKVLDDENLYKNKSLMSKLSNILMSIYYKEQVDVVNTVLDNEKLLNNIDVLSSLHGWLSSMEGVGFIKMEKLEQVNKLLKTLK